jgi:hypothetical protein
MSTSITIDELAIMIQEGFTHVDGRLDDVIRRLDHIEKSLIADHERRIARLEDALAIPSRR